jgi:hypothetical protein
MDSPKVAMAGTKVIMPSVAQKMPIPDMFLSFFRQAEK